MSQDVTIRKLERELERSEKDPKDVGAQLLGTERGRWFLLCSMPIPGLMSVAVNVEVQAGRASAATPMWKVAIDRVEDVLKAVALGNGQDAAGWPYGVTDIIATIYDAAKGEAVGDLVLGHRRPLGAVRVWTRKPGEDPPPAIISGQDGTPVTNPARPVAGPVAAAAWTSFGWIALADEARLHYFVDSEANFSRCGLVRRMGAAAWSGTPYCSACRDAIAPHQFTIECDFCGVIQGSPAAQAPCPRSGDRCDACRPLPGEVRPRCAPIRAAGQDCTGSVESPCMCPCGDES